MAQIERWYEQDLKKPVQVQAIGGNVFSLDNNGTLIGVRVYDNGETAELSGSVTAYCTLADGQTVSVAGTREENRVYFSMPQSALAVPGTIKIVVKLTEDTTITTLAALIGTVYRSRSDTIITPSSQVITDWAEEISAEIQNCVDARTSLAGIIAAAYSTSSAYAVGAYCQKDGKLYRCTTAITSGESWTAGHWTEVKLGNDVSDLKSASDALINDVIAEFGTINLGSLNSGAYIKKSDGAYSTSSNWSYTNYIATNEKKALMFTCPKHTSSNVLTAVASLAFYTNSTNSAFIPESGVGVISGTSGEWAWIVVPVPATAKYFRASVFNNSSSSYKIIEIDNIKDIISEINALNTVAYKNEFVLPDGSDLDDLLNNGNTLTFISKGASHIPDHYPAEFGSEAGMILTNKMTSTSSSYGNQIAVRIPDGLMMFRSKASTWREWTYLTQKKSLKILCIGNSFALDNMSYMPFILQNIAPDIDLTLVVAFSPSASIDDHIDAFDNDTTTYFKCIHKSTATAWVSPDERDATLKEILASEQWDFITFQQASSEQRRWETYANLNGLIDRVIGYLNDQGSHSVRLGWLMPQLQTQQETYYADIMTNVQNVLATTPIDFVIPCGTAVQNARGTSLQSLGDESNLTYDGKHLQEGLPCMIGAYTATIKILELCGMAFMGIMGEKTVPSTAWLSGKNIPNPHGSSVGATTANCYIAQKCAVAAMKKPYEISTIVE